MKDEWPKIRKALCAVTGGLLLMFLYANRKAVESTLSNPTTASDFVAALRGPRMNHIVEWKGKKYEVSQAIADAAKSYPEFTETLLERVGKLQTDDRHVIKWEDLTPDQKERVIVPWGTEQVRYVEILAAAESLHCKPEDIRAVGNMAGMEWEYVARAANAATRETVPHFADTISTALNEKRQ